MENLGTEEGCACMHEGVQDTVFENPEEHTCTAQVPDINKLLGQALWETELNRIVAAC